MVVHELQGLVRKGAYEKIDCQHHQVKSLLKLDDLHDIKFDYDLNEYFNLYQVKEKIWVITDLEGYYISLIRSYCGDNYCLCSNTYLSQTDHVRLNTVLSVLWEDLKEDYAGENPFKKITNLTEIDLC